MIFTRRWLMSLLLTMSVMLSAQAQSDTIRVLMVGNSYARDAYSYVPFLVEELSPDTYVEMGILYIGSCTLKTHWNHVVDNANAYELDFYGSNNAEWRTVKNVSIHQGLNLIRWDLIMLQQQSEASQNYGTCQPYLDNLSGYIQRHFPESKLGWTLTPAYPEGYKTLKGQTSNEMWRKVVSTAELIMKHDYLKLLIPVGTAVQVARQIPELDALGDFGHLSYEGLHLQEGPGCLMSAYVATHKLMEFFQKPVDIMQSNLKIDRQWVMSKKIPQAHGVAPAISDSLYNECKACAISAIEEPFQIF